MLLVKTVRYVITYLRLLFVIQWESMIQVKNNDTPSVEISDEYRKRADNMIRLALSQTGNSDSVVVDAKTSCTSDLVVSPSMDGESQKGSSICSLM